MRQAFRRFYPLLLLLVFLCPQNACAQWQKNMEAGRAAYKQGRYLESKKAFSKALSEAEKFAPKDSRLSQSLVEYGDLEQTFAEYALAEPIFKRVAAVGEQGGNDSMVATGLRRLSGLYETEARYRDAEPLMERVVAVDEKTLRPDSIVYAADLHDLGRLKYTLNERTMAEPLCLQAQEILKKASERNDSESAIALDKLGTIYKRECKESAAEPLYKRALVLQAKYGDAHAQVMTLIDLGKLYKEQGKYKLAEDFYKQAVALEERTAGANHPDLAVTLNLIGHLYKADHRYPDAEQVLKRALTLRETALGPNHPDVAQILSSQGAVYLEQDDFELAETPFKRALAICEKVFGSNHPAVFSCLRDYASLLRKTNRNAEAEKFEAKAKAIQYKHWYDGRVP